MLEKQKEWLKEKTKKGKEIVKKEKGNICFGLGMAAMAGIYLIFEKINEPKTATIWFDRSEDDHVMGLVNYTNRFGSEKELITIDYGVGRDADEKGITKLCNKLCEIAYPGD